MSLARTRTRRVEPIASPTRCWCRPTLIGTWRDELLVSVAREHRQFCGLPAVQLDPVEFQRTAR